MIKVVDYNKVNRLYEIHFENDGKVTEKFKARDDGEVIIHKIFCYSMDKFLDTNIGCDYNDDILSDECKDLYLSIKEIIIKYKEGLV